MYKMKFLGDDYQKQIFDQSIRIIERHNKVGLNVFTSGGKSPISAEIISYLMEQKGCKNTVVIAKDSTWSALTSRYKSIGFSLDNVYHVKNAMLSRGHALKECIKEQGINPDDIDIVLFDECHEVFGNNIRSELKRNEDYIYSKYVIAMTATTSTGIKAIDSLDELVGNKNVVVYNLNEAVSNEIIDPLVVVNAKLKYSKDYYDYLNTLEGSLSTKCRSKAITKMLDDARKVISNSNINSLEDLMYNTIDTSVKKHKLELNCKEGARVIVFYNRIVDIDNNEELITNVIKKFYNTDKINFVKYTSKSTPVEEERAIRVLTSDKCEPNTVDIIATCDMGAESFHPANMQIELIMGGTASLRKEIQRLGRMVVQKRYKNCDCIIVNFSNMDMCTGKNNIIRGALSVDFRAKNIEQLSRYFTESGDIINEIISEYDGSITFDISEIDDTIYKRIVALNLAASMLDDNDDLIAYIDSHLVEIDKEFAGNIAKFLNNKYKVDKEVSEKGFYNKYAMLRDYLVYPMLSEKELAIVKETLGKYGVRVYLSANMSSDKANYTRRLYKELEDGTASADKYWKDFMYKEITINNAGKMTREAMPSECSTLIFRNKELLHDIFDKFLSIRGMYFDISKTSLLYKAIELYVELIKKHDDYSGVELNKIRYMITVWHKYLDTMYGITKSSKNKVPERVRNLLSNLLIIPNELGIKLRKLDRKDIMTIKYLTILEIQRNKLNASKVEIKDRLLNNYLIELYSKKKLNSIENYMIQWFIYDKVDENGQPMQIEDFIYDSLKFSEVFKVVYKAYTTRAANDLFDLLDYVDNGGEIPKKIEKEYSTKLLLTQAETLREVRDNKTDVDKALKKKKVSISQIISLFIEDNDVINAINCAVASKKHEVSLTKDDCSKLIKNTRSKINNSHITELSKLLNYNMVLSNIEMSDTIRELVAS